MNEPQHPDILTRLMHFCVSPDIFVREEISGGYVRDMLRDARDEIDRLRAAVRRLAEQDATLSVVGGNVTVEIDAALTDAEREAVLAGMQWCLSATRERMAPDSYVQANATFAATLRGLLERTKQPAKQPARSYAQTYKK